MWWLSNLSALPIKVELCYIKPLAKFNFQETWALSSFRTFLDLSTLTEEQFHCQLPVSLGAYKVSYLAPDTSKSLCISGHAGLQFDIDMLVSLLRQENARDICVIKVPPEMKYTDYFVIGSGTSTRHLHAMAYYIVKMVGCPVFSLEPLTE